MLSAPTSKYLIYGLVDPSTNQLRYIGLSTRGIGRPKAHLCDGPAFQKRYENSRFNKYQCWRQSLIKLGIKPEIIVIEECSSIETLNEAEEFYIAYYKSIGCNLVNHAPGGLYKTKSTKGIKKSEDTKRLMSQKMKEYWSKNKEEKLAVTEPKRLESLKRNRKPISEERKQQMSKQINSFRSDTVKRNNWLNKIKEFSKKRSKKLKDQFGTEYDSIHDAARKTGVNRSNITKQLNGKVKQSKGFIFTILEN